MLGLYKEMCKRILKKGHFRTIGPSDYRAVTNETTVKKIKDNNDLNDLDLTDDARPILSIGLVPPSDEVIEIDNDNVNGL